MSKELEILKKLNLIQKVFEKLADWNGYDLSRLDEDFETNFDLDFCNIENALKELEERREMMKKFNDACVPMILDNETEKKLKALEIIKHFIKSLGLTFIFSNDKTIVIVGGDEFEYWYKCKTQEEYDLLKEVLKDE